MRNLLNWPFDRGRNATGLIYGTVITAATLVGAAEGVRNEGEIAVTVLVTLVLYWIAHAYAGALGGAGHTSHHVWLAAVHELVAESPMLFACLLPLAAMLVASALGASFDIATSVAVWLAVGLLFLWGLLAAYRAQSRMGPPIVSGIVFGLVGLGIVALKTTFVH